jgi:hypothetical protein
MCNLSCPPLNLTLSCVSVCSTAAMSKLNFPSSPYNINIYESIKITFHDITSVEIILCLTCFLQIACVKMKKTQLIQSTMKLIVS